MEAKVILTTELQLKAIVADAVNAALKYYQPHTPARTEAEPFGDFQWLCSTCSGVPASTLRIKSAAGEIPGVVKVGKRVLYNKEDVLLWLISQTHTLSNAAIREQAAEEQFTTQHQRKGGRKA